MIQLIESLFSGWVGLDLLFSRRASCFWPHGVVHVHGLRIQEFMPEFENPSQNFQSNEYEFYELT